MHFSPHLSDYEVMLIFISLCRWYCAPHLADEKTEAQNKKRNQIGLPQDTVYISVGLFIHETTWPQNHIHYPWVFEVKKMMHSGPRVLEEGNHNTMDCKGNPTIDNSYFLTEEGRVQRRWLQPNHLQRQLLLHLACLWRGTSGSTLFTAYWGRIEALPPGCSFSHFIQITLGSEKCRFWCCGAWVGLEKLHVSQISGEANATHLGTTHCRTRLSGFSTWTTPMLTFQNRVR